MTHGKKVCKILKEIRRQIAEKNDIALVISECHFQGECKGTCPKCEAEVRHLENELNKRKQLGKAVAIAGISLGVAGTFTGCGTPKQNQSTGNEAEVTTEREAEMVNIDTVSIATVEGFKEEKKSEYTICRIDGLVTGDIDYTFVPDTPLSVGELPPIELVEKMPEYHGGMEELYKFLQTNIEYPEVAIKEGVGGIVVVEFVVEKDGRIGRAKVIAPLHPACDKEALRVIEMMPNWIPGKKDGKRVAVYYQLPVQFSLQGDKK